jgi:hypothetical protein
MSSVSNACVKMDYYTLSKEQVDRKICSICKEPLQGIALGHFAEKINELFHQACLFKHCATIGDNCPLCNAVILEPQGNMLFYYLFPKFKIKYPNNPANLEVGLRYLSSIYAFFLTEEAHSGYRWSEMSDMGIDVEQLDVSHKYASAKKVGLFAQYLMTVIHAEPKTERELKFGIDLQTAWTPQEGPLREALEKSKIRLRKWHRCFPYYTQSVIKISEKWIEFDVRLDSVGVSKERAQYANLPDPDVQM